MNTEQQDRHLFPTLTTPRLLLRKLEINDAPEIFSLRSDDRVNQYLDRPKAANLAAAKEFIETITTGIEQNKCFYWAISLKNDPELIGTICLWNGDKEHAMIETGYELLPVYQGKGLMQEALLEIIKYAFKTLDVKTIIACPVAANEKSVRLLERNGFIANGINEGNELVYSLKSPVTF